jgi:hypothetical protein
VFKITRNAPGRHEIHLQADAVLTPADFEHIARQLGAPRLWARKIAYVAARQATKPEVIETRWNGKETISTACPGDWIVTSLTLQQKVLRDRESYVNTYVVLAERFAELYEPTGGRNELGAIYRPKGMVLAVSLPEGFDIVLMRGERQIARTGYLLLNGGHVYGNHAETFTATYELLAD